MAKTYKDELNRDFIEVKTIAEILGFSERHAKRLIRTNNWLSIKRGKRFILIDDFRKTHPDLFSTLLSKIEQVETEKVDISDIKQTSEIKNGVQDVQKVQNLEKTDKEIVEFESLSNKEILYQKTVNTIQRLEKTLANIEYIQKDTLKIDGRLEKQAKELKNLTDLVKKQREPKIILWLKGIVLVVMLLMILFLFVKVYSMLKTI
ncbi:MAG: hypothetical protein L6300_09305 [Syntrophaceae bacterium]|nr:hypothetical protein [Pseudomonadota bacterium]MBU4287335.1 hypothetical protein [Pseudomonadota bacterium]MBU4403913.1 hypothetical protein [Actinomycetota bacterium]MCG2740420.1 hypothetical protein [Syntrophaceae bacterium]